MLYALSPSAMPLTYKGTLAGQAKLALSDLVCCLHSAGVPPPAGWFHPLEPAGSKIHGSWKKNHLRLEIQHFNHEFFSLPKNSTLAPWQEAETQKETHLNQPSVAGASCSFQGGYLQLDGISPNARNSSIYSYQIRSHDRLSFAFCQPER